ncbi:hypothetical protein [Blastomonas sp. UPD001]|uniref:hypothetical protein n=1 Tax=Blastomonas sp. UPD001 TaxID=2217673 RepID=UPI001300349C|nr:hypothetical protein [Blastomonas sp. UPD001]
MDNQKLRWSATIHYRTDAVGLVDVTHELHELEDIHDVVERGPHWDTIDRIVIVRGKGASDSLTVEQAAGI